MKWIKYQIVCNEDENVLLNKKLEYTTANLAIAQNEAYNGEYAIVEDEVSFGTKPLSIEFGGTGATNASGALTKLGALAASKRGAANGVAPLNSSKKIDSTYLPSMNYVSASQVGVVNGIASLDSSGKVPSYQLPSMNYIPTSQKGAAYGVAPLNASKKIDSTYLPSLPDMDYIPTSQKGAANGVASLDSGAKIPSGQLPLTEYTTMTVTVDGVKATALVFKIGRLVVVKLHFSSGANPHECVFEFQSAPPALIDNSGAFFTAPLLSLQDTTGNNRGYGGRGLHSASAA